MSEPAARGTASAQPPVASPLPAATVVVLRDGDRGAEVLLVQRHGKSAFMPGATVFPGGKVDAADASAPCWGAATAADGFDAVSTAAALVAAVRELHEEAHVLLARDGVGAVARPQAVAALDDAVAGLREGHRLRSSDWHGALAALGLQADVAAVVPFAHWVTPVAEPRRFDTLFVAALLPEGQAARPDNHETTDLRWMTPASAVAAHAAGGEVLLPPPTLHTLQRLAALAARFPSADALLQALRGEGCGPRIEPWFAFDSGGAPVIALPWDPLHPQAVAYLARHGAALAQMTAVASSCGDGPQPDRFVLDAGRFCRRTA